MFNLFLGILFIAVGITNWFVSKNSDSMALRLLPFVSLALALFFLIKFFGPILILFGLGSVFVIVLLSVFKKVSKKQNE